MVPFTPASHGHHPAEGAGRAWGNKAKLPAREGFRRLDLNCRLALRLDAPDQRSDIGPAEILHGTEAGRRGDVDLGQVAVDHVDADEE